MHCSTKNPRREFLKAVGVSIALPFLPSAPQARAALKSPKRMVFICSSLGLNPGSFFPRNFGKDFTPSILLEPIKDLRSDLTVFSHTDHPHLSNRHESKATFLTGVKAAQSSIGNGISIDQLAAEHVGYATRFPSVHISIGGAQQASWSRSGIKMREAGHPKDLFTKLFVNDSSAANKLLEKELDRQGSVLDLVKGQAKMLGRKVSPEDRDKLEEYLTAIREAEFKIQGVKKWKDTDKPKGSLDELGEQYIDRQGKPNYRGIVKTMFDLIYLAIESDSSRVFTAGFGTHNHVLDLDGVTGGYHGLTHHGKSEAKLKQLNIIEKSYVEHYAKLVQRLKDTPSGSGNLLDDTMVLIGSGLGNAANHSGRNLPVMLAGGGLKHQGHMDVKQSDGRNMPLNNIYTSMLQNFGVQTESFNGATGTVSELHA